MNILALIGYMVILIIVTSIVSFVTIVWLSGGDTVDDLRYFFPIFSFYMLLFFFIHSAHMLYKFGVIW